VKAVKQLRTVLQVLKRQSLTAVPGSCTGTGTKGFGCVVFGRVAEPHPFHVDPDAGF